ncbi:MAG: serine/threonine protein kinase, partial [Methylococcaceae bacterium]|nr:serine/threonine protein kinase [Methylococcaceae bacterium]
MSNKISEKTITAAGDDPPTVLKAGAVDSGLRVGMTLKNRFVLEKILGQGGMGTIFKARDRLKEEMEDRKPFVAIKVLHPKFQRNESLIKALQREARKSQELAHPNIVNVHDFDRDGKYVFMVMEFLQGKPLNILIERGGLDTIPLEERWSMIGKIGRGIAYAHEKKVIHYDIKPGNVFICDDGNVKILDFGIAKAHRSSSEANMTVFDQFSPEALTPAYATCEMLRWEPPDIRDDVYAFGCVAYEILTGRHPFNKMPALKAAKAGMNPAPIKGLPKQQWQAIKSTLEFKREDRMPDIVHFLNTGFGNRTGRKKKSSYVIAAAGLLVVIALAIWQVMPFLDGGSRIIGVPPEHETPQGTERLPERKGPPPTPETQRKIERILKIAESHAAIGRIIE